MPKCRPSPHAWDHLCHEVPVSTVSQNKLPAPTCRMKQAPVFFLHILGISHREVLTASIGYHAASMRRVCARVKHHCEWCMHEYIGSLHACVAASVSARMKHLVTPARDLRANMRFPWHECWSDFLSRLCKAQSAYNIMVYCVEQDP